MIHVPTAPWTHLVFDLAAWSGGAAVGFGLYRWRLKDRVRDLAAVTGPGYFVSLAAGAVAGAWAAGSLNTLQGPAPELSHSIAGALVGAIVAVELYKALRGIRGSTGTIFVGSFATGVIIGRWGCFFAGLPDRTYGTPTALPWGVDLGDGISRHPVQIYESLAMAAFLAVYIVGLARRAPWAMRRGFYALAFWYGAQRFVWEFLKPYPRVVGPFNLFHVLCAGLVSYGALYYLRDLAAERAGRAQDCAVSFPRPDHQPL
ncbi:MAG: prolipoprotein diacylglyceryl transferase family protein [Caulobacterales bacterium]